MIGDICLHELEEALHHDLACGSHIRALVRIARAARDLREAIARDDSRLDEELDGVCRAVDALDAAIGMPPEERR